MVYYHYLIVIFYQHHLLSFSLIRHETKSVLTTPRAKSGSNLKAFLSYCFSMGYWKNYHKCSCLLQHPFIIPHFCVSEVQAQNNWISVHGLTGLKSKHWPVLQFSLRHGIIILGSLPVGRTHFFALQEVPIFIIVISQTTLNSYSLPIVACHEAPIGSLQHEHLISSRLVGAHLLDFYFYKQAE